jgi:hypothetical protein
MFRRGFGPRRSSDTSFVLRTIDFPARCKSSKTENETPSTISLQGIRRGGRLRGRRCSALRTAAGRKLHQRIVPQPIEVDSILVAAGDRRNARVSSALARCLSAIHRPLSIRQPIPPYSTSSGTGGLGLRPCSGSSTTIPDGKTRYLKCGTPGLLVERCRFSA